MYLADTLSFRQPEGGHEKDSLYLPPGSSKMKVDLMID
jgi:hypothetical protein